MRQTRLMSLVKTLANVGAGFGPALLVQILVYLAIGLRVTVMQSVRLSPASHCSRSGAATRFGGCSKYSVVKLR